MVPHCDVVTINAPLHPETEGLFGDKLIGRWKRGAYLINTARAKIADRDAIDERCVAASSRVRGRRVVPAARPADTRGGPCRTTA